jgi:hypothetical protein
MSILTPRNMAGRRFIMTVKFGLRFLTAAAAAVALLAFAPPALAQSYSDSFNGPTLNSWWTQNIGGDLSFSFSNTQFHTSPASLQVQLTQNGGEVELTHVFSAPVHGDFSVWVYDDPSLTTNQIHDLSETLWIRSADWQQGVQVELQGWQYSAYASDGVTSSSCDLAPRAASAEWRKLHATVGNADITVQVENGSGVVGACTFPYAATALTTLILHVGDESLNFYPPSPVAYLDDFNCSQCGTGYTVSLLYDPLKAAKSGSTIPIKLQLLSGGVNVSAANLVLHAVVVLKMDNSAPSQVHDAGNANPDFDFRYDPTLGGSGGYIFNLKTTGLTTGTYHLKFTVNGLGDYTANFAVR